MERRRSVVKWDEVNKVKDKGMGEVCGMEGIVEGCDCVVYLEWREGGGGCEKLDGGGVGDCGDVEKGGF
ncbi:beta-galactosidase, partial [Bacillus altitudinis]|uniref:beta-galactosidase n=1 Tax=Bacillus altitudinis TaxID=293387 RepID=UPI001F20001F